MRRCALCGTVEYRQRAKSGLIGEYPPRDAVTHAAADYISRCPSCCRFRPESGGYHGCQCSGYLFQTGKNHNHGKGNIDSGRRRHQFFSHISDSADSSPGDQHQKAGKYQSAGQGWHMPGVFHGADGRVGLDHAAHSKGAHQAQKAVQHSHSPEPQSPFHVYKRTAYVMSVLIPVPVPDSQHGLCISGYHADQG